MQVKISVQAAEDIVSIAQYTLLNFGPDQARKYHAGLEYSFELLADNPRLGQEVRRSDRAGEFRRYIYKSHYVFYEIQPNAIIIGTIRNTRQAMPEEWD
ncbi:MAG: type II toxin-antitoxin system RelE/ParE family toxin [Pseudomonadota bacterium]